MGLLPCFLLLLLQIDVADAKYFYESAQIFLDSLAFLTSPFDYFSHPWSSSLESWTEHSKNHWSSSNYVCLVSMGNHGTEILWEISHDKLISMNSFVLISQGPTK